MRSNIHIMPYKFGYIAGSLALIAGIIALIKETYIFAISFFILTILDFYYITKTKHTMETKTINNNK